MKTEIKTQHIHPPIPMRGFDWLATVDDMNEDSPQGWGSTEEKAVADLKAQLEADEDPCQSEDYQHYVAEVAKNCVASNGPCDACLAGGICDGDHLDPLCLVPDDDRDLLDYE